MSARLAERAHRYDVRRVRGLMFEGLCGFATVIAVGVLFAVIGYVVVNGAQAINVAFFTQLPKPVGESGGGVANAILGTVMIVGIAAALSLPVGVLTGVYLSEYGGHGWFSTTVRFLSDVLTGVPSIVVGVLAYQLVVVPMRHFSAFAGGVALAVLMLPTIVRTTEELLRLVPRGLREASLALGVRRWRTITSVVLPTASGGLITGVMLALARAAGETAPLLFTAFGNTYWNLSANQPTEALSLQIYQYAISPYDDWHAKAWASSLVLVLMVLILSIIVRVVTAARLQGRE